MKFKLCPECRQDFSTTSAGLELLFTHLLTEHGLTEEAATKAVDSAVVEEREEALPQPLPQCG